MYILNIFLKHYCAIWAVGAVMQRDANARIFEENIIKNLISAADCDSKVWRRKSEI